MTTRARIAVIAIVSLITVLLAVVFATRFGADPRLSPSPLIGKTVPDATIDLVDSDDQLRLRDLTGQIAVVNFWAPWCVPCRAEHADLLELTADFGDLDVSVMGIAYQSRRDNVNEFLDELGRGYTVGMDDRSRAAIGFGVRGVPETYFVDRDGTVVAKISGPISLGLATATVNRMILGDPVESTRTGELQTSP